MVIVSSFFFIYIYSFVLAMNNNNKNPRRMISFIFISCLHTKWCSGCICVEENEWPGYTQTSQPKGLFAVIALHQSSLPI